MSKIRTSGFVASLKSVAGDFLSGVWYGMGPDPSRTIKKPKGEGSVPVSRIKEAVKKAKSRRG